MEANANQHVCDFIQQWVGDTLLNPLVNETNVKALGNKLGNFNMNLSNNKLFFL